MCLQRLAVFSISYLKCFCFAVFFGVIFNLHACAFFIVCILLFDCSLCLLLLFFVVFCGIPIFAAFDPLQCVCPRWLLYLNTSAVFQHQVHSLDKFKWAISSCVYLLEPITDQPKLH